MKITDIIHVFLYLLLIITPYISSKKFLNIYGIYLSIFMTFVIIGWLLNKGQCILFFKDSTTHDSNYKYGLTSAFLAEYLNFNKKYSKYSAMIFELLYVVSAYILANSNTMLKQIITISAIINLYNNQLYQ